MYPIDELLVGQENIDEAVHTLELLDFVDYLTFDLDFFRGIVCVVGDPSDLKS